MDGCGGSARGAVAISAAPSRGAGQPEAKPERKARWMAVEGLRGPGRNRRRHLLSTAARMRTRGPGALEPDVLRRIARGEDPWRVPPGAPEKGIIYLR